MKEQGLEMAWLDEAEKNSAPVGGTSTAGDKNLAPGGGTSTAGGEKRKRRKFVAVSEAAVKLGDEGEDGEREEPVLFTMEGVCRALGLRRRVVVGMRVGLGALELGAEAWGVSATGEVGLTRSWCEWHGLNVGDLEVVRPGRTTVRSLGIGLGVSAVAAERVADGCVVKLVCGDAPVRAGMEVEAIRQGDSYVLASRVGWKLW